MRGVDAVKHSFFTGLALVAPIVVTVFVVRLLLVWTLGVVDPIVEAADLARYTADVKLAARVLTPVLVVCLVTLIGYVARRPAAQRLIGGMGRAVDLVPLVRTIYSSVRGVATALVERSDRYESVVLVEYPRDGIYSIGFVTSESPAAVRSVTGGRAYNVFLPNSPNPTAGRLVVVPEDRVHEIEMTAGQGIRTLVTTGMAEEAARELVASKGGVPTAVADPLDANSKL